MKRTAAVLLVLVCQTSDVVMAQGYRLRLDTRYQSVAFRGVTPDSIAFADVVVGPNGGLQTPDGIAVRCPPGSATCFFFRPGPERRGGPCITSADVSMWNLGLPGLRVHSTLRTGFGLGDEPEPWPGTEPTVQLIEAFVEHASRRTMLKLGRMHRSTRFGFVGFDGGDAEIRLLSGRWRTSVFGGWGLARGVALAVTDAALNPLDDFQPERRQHVFGAALGWTGRWVRGDATYLREIDPRAQDFVSERGSIAASVFGPHTLRLSGGAEYDIAAGWWGSADVEASVEGRWIGGAGGFRRYRPHFELWTIWGAFSPVPHQTRWGALTLRPVRDLVLLLQGERYAFDASAAETPLVTVENEGWRWSARAAWSPVKLWRLAYRVREEFGPGAAALEHTGEVQLRAPQRITWRAYGGRVLRPLEFRFDAARLWQFGAVVGVAPRDDLDLAFDALYVDEERERPDAAHFDWDQVRFGLRASYAFGSSLAAPQLPASVLAIPRRQVPQR